LPQQLSLPSTESKAAGEEKVPAVQPKQLEAPPFENFPAVHAVVHADKPEELAK
jgi:hypothetical protein